MVLGLTPMQKRFAKVHAKTGDETYAAWMAGYANPEASGKMLKKNQAVMEFSRASAQRFLFEKAGSLSVTTLVELAGPDRQDGIRFKAAQELAKLANIAITDLAAEKPPSELTAGELGSMVDEMKREFERQQAIAARALASLPRAIFEHEPSTSIFD